MPRRRALLLSAALLVAVALALLAPTLRHRRPDSPPESLTWDHAELLAHLTSRGVKLEEGSRVIRKLGCDPFQVWERPDWRLPPTDPDWRPRPILTVQQLADPNAATHYARFARGFAWGRFVIAGDRELLEDVRAVLGDHEAGPQKYFGTRSGSW
jgi:hypothetical protein